MGTRRHIAEVRAATGAGHGRRRFPAAHPPTTIPPDLNRGDFVESSNVLGTLWAAFGMTAYYLALVWINTLLGLFLTPLFLIPLTWLQDRMRGGKTAAPAAAR